MESIQTIAEAITNIVKLMADKPDDVSVEVVPVRGGMILRYSVAPSDIGKLIGAHGRNARSLWVIVAAIGMGAKLRISLDIPSGSPDRSGPDQR